MANVFSILFPINICNAPMDLGNKRNVLKKSTRDLNFKQTRDPFLEKPGNFSDP